MLFKNYWNWSLVKPARLIVFEGADAAGKSTVCENYLRALSSREITAKLLSFPGKDPGTLGNLIYQIHHAPQSVGVGQLTSASLQALHIAAHLDTIETAILPSLEAGDTIVLDRYWWSTWVYGIVGGANSLVLQALIEAERAAWGRWTPTAVFHVIRSTPLREEPLDAWDKLRREYEGIAERESVRYPVYKLSNDGLLEDTVSEVLALTHGI